MWEKDGDYGVCKGVGAIDGAIAIIVPNKWRDNSIALLRQFSYGILKAPERVPI